MRTKVGGKTQGQSKKRCRKMQASMAFKVDGVARLLKLLGKMCAKEATPDVGTEFNYYLNALRRRRLETMTQWRHRAEVTYLNLRKATARAVNEETGAVPNKEKKAVKEDTWKSVWYDIDESVKSSELDKDVQDKRFPNKMVKPPMTKTKRQRQSQR